ncbi:MAG: adenine phosphoribosyltransferase [Syntrophomonadaceae bacterium]|jgi:adenine phosphoribosyltransferase|nr:adenine phosphoribosyltransferase [Syntrophomonadaceae bacterium]
MPDHKEKTYTLEIAGLTRHLPIIPVNDETKIASFVILGDTELVCRVAPELIKKMPHFDVLVTAEAKGIPLAFEISRLLGMNYIVARKSIKSYMENPVIEEVNSITTQKTQILSLNGDDIKQIKNRRVAIVDDVISTGESVQAVARLIEKAGGNVVAKAAILAEGDAALNPDIIYLKKLPVF